MLYKLEELIMDETVRHCCMEIVVFIKKFRNRTEQCLSQ